MAPELLINKTTCSGDRLDRRNLGLCKETYNYPNTSQSYYAIVFLGVIRGGTAESAGFSVDIYKKQQFETLRDLWKQATSPASDIYRRTRHPLYRQIVQMGKDVLPFVFSEMKKEPLCWFHAALEITGENPVPKEHAGIVGEMQKEWLAWAEENKLVNL